MCKCDECMFGNQKEVDCNGFSCGEFYELQEKHDKLIRAELIDEFVNILINPDNYERYAFVNCLTDSNKAYDFMSYVYDISKQLKEQNNG